MPNHQKYTYEDYCSWDDDQRWELIHGVPYAMLTPNIIHQEIVVNLVTEFRIFLKGKPCKIFVAPFDVRLNSDKDDNIVVRPDLTLVCDPGKRTLRGCVGAPDMVIEILSPSTRERDLVLKQDIYLEAGVKEYWIIDPESKTVFVKLLNYNKYKTNIYNGYEIIPASVLKGLSVDMNLVYPQFP